MVPAFRPSQTWLGDDARQQKRYDQTHIANSKLESRSYEIRKHGQLEQLNQREFVESMKAFSKIIVEEGNGQWSA